MRVEGPAAPAHEQPDGEAGDQEPDRGLGAALHRFGEVRAVEDDRTPTVKRVSACPAPQAAPRVAASRARRSVEARSVVTAARWSGSVAWRRPSRIATAI